ncbi:hypothetical protein AX15_007050 [Amanita polypyramis BW_CC]|nr:hypothetical protein AX15_007050 [Amanita polypyramis BW_CC]
MLLQLCSPGTIWVGRRRVLRGERGQTRTQESDVYAFGCLYYDAHFGIVPFANAREIQIVMQVMDGKWPPRLSSPAMSDQTWELISNCWRKESVRRPTLETMMHPSEKSPA